MPKIFYVNHQAIYAYDIISFENVIAAESIEVQPLTSSSDIYISMRFETLTCDDANGTLTLPTFKAKPFSILGEYVVGEADGAIAITITRTCLPDCTNAGVVVVNTADFTATAGVDYTPLQDEPVNFVPAETDATVSLSIVDDAYVDPDELLVVYIAIQVNGEIYHDSFTYITIKDND
ncbi:uncharacterized protein [Amphiura filiformis]|uniref:uncharacterized protein n=1 Tax=Amphiura filiformis TaxID=82378 RepID=UPI003B21F81A